MQIVIMLAAILAANFYVFFRLWNMIPLEGAWKTVFVVAAAALISFMFLPILAGHLFPLWLSSFMYKVGTSWFFVFFYLLLIFVLLDLVRLTHLLPVGKFMSDSWMGTGILAGLLTVVFTISYINYRNKQRIELDIVTGKELPADKPLKIVAVSDLHLGYGIGQREFEKWITLINNEEPDVVVMAGDIIDNSVYPLVKKDYASSFRKIRSKYGVFVIPGNHEYISGIGKSLDFLNSADVTVLKDSVAFVNGLFYIVGRDDRTNPYRKPLAELIAGTDRSKPILILDHQPYELEEAETNGINIQFSGHTHYGQVWPISALTRLMYENAHGLIKKGDSNIYVSSGLGIWGGKFRIGTRSEYVVINLIPGS